MLTAKPRLTPSAVALIAGNSIPILGVLFLGWDVFALVFLYWMENGVIGIFTVLKMLTVGGKESWATKSTTFWS